MNNPMNVSHEVTNTDGELPRRPAAWGAVLAMSLGAFALVASEFMPVSLLTPIAADLHISEGQAGQAISISGAFAVLTSLFISTPGRTAGPQGIAPLANASDDRIGNGRGIRSELYGVHARPGAHRRCHRRLLVDVRRDGYPARAGRPGPAGVGDREWQEMRWRRSWLRPWGAFSAQSSAGEVHSFASFRSRRLFSFGSSSASHR